MHLKMLPEAAQLTDDMRARNMEQTHTSAAAFVSVGWTQWGCFQTLYVQHAGLLLTHAGS